MAAVDFFFENCQRHLLTLEENNDFFDLGPFFFQFERQICAVAKFKSPDVLYVRRVMFVN